MVFVDIIAKSRVGTILGIGKVVTTMYDDDINYQLIMAQSLHPVPFNITSGLEKCFPNLRIKIKSNIATKSHVPLAVNLRFPVKLYPGLQVQICLKVGMTCHSILFTTFFLDV